MADPAQTEAEFQVARDFVGFLDRQPDPRPELMAELKSVFAQYQKTSTIAHAKDVKFNSLCFRMAGLRVMDKVRGNQSRVPWMARGAARNRDPKGHQSHRYEAVDVVKEILAEAAGPVTHTALLVQYTERTGRKLAADLGHDQPRVFFQKNPNFVVVEDRDPKDKVAFTISLSERNGRHLGRMFVDEEEGEGREEDYPLEEQHEVTEPLPPPNPLPEGTSWSRVAAGEKVIKPKADLQKIPSPRLDAEDKSLFPPLSAAAALAAANSPAVLTPSPSALFRGDDDVFKPIVSTVEECEEACSKLCDARELAALFKSAVGQEDKLSLVQVASSEFVFLFDMLSPVAGRFKEYGLGALLEDPSIRLLVCDAVATVKMMKRAGFAPKEVMDVRLVYQELLNHSGDLGDLIALVSEADQPYVKKQARYWMSRPISSDQRELASLEATSLFDAMQKLQEKASEALLADCLAKSMRAATDQRHSGDKPAPVHEKKTIQRFISAPLAKSGAVPSAAPAAPVAASPPLSASTSATATLVTKILVKEPAAAVAGAPVPHRPAAAQSAHPVASAVATQPLLPGAPPAPQQHQQSALHQQQALQHQHDQQQQQQQQAARVQVQKPPSPTAVTAVAVATAAIASPVVSRFMAAPPLIVSASTSPRGPRPVADVNTDFVPIFAVLPPSMAAGIAERMPDFLSTLHSIAIDVGQRVTLTRLYQEPPVRLAEPVLEQELRHICDAIGAATLLSRQSAPIGESLHIAHALVDPASQQVTGLTLRVGRAVVGASDVLHDIVVSGKNVVLLGFGKTTLLRDIVARRSLNEQHVVMVLDTRGELGGLRAVAHPSLGHVRRVVPGREGQTGLIRASIEKHAAKVLAIDELWAHDDFVELRSHARIRGVQIIAGCPARDAAEFKALRPVADFDTVVEVLSPVSFRVSYLASNTTQLRMRTPQGVVIRDESL